MKRLILICTSFLLMMTGCAQKRIIDDLAMINAIGYDLAEDEDEKLKVTATFPIITKDGKYDRETLVVTGKSSKAAREKLKTETNLQMESGQVRVSLFGNELAKQGLLPYLDTFVRDPNIGSRVMLALGKNEASEILTLQIENEGQNATYLEQFITKLHIESKAINYNIYQFLRDLYDDGMDPILPVFKVENDKLKYDGVGLFKKDKLIDLLDPIDSRFLFLFRDEIKHGDLDFEIELEEGPKEQIMLNYVQTKHHIHVNSVAKDKLSATIDIEIIGDVLEYTGKADLSDPKIQMKAEKLLSKQLDKKAKEMVAQLQELQVDPIGIGRRIRNKMTYKQWKALNWHEAYQNMNVNVKTKVKLSSGGKWK
jgi:spore germination protein